VNAMDAGKVLIAIADGRSSATFFVRKHGGSGGAHITPIHTAGVENLLASPRVALLTGLPCEPRLLPGLEAASGDTLVF